MTTETFPIALSDAAPGGELTASSFSNLVQIAGSYPMLTADQEREYATKWEQEGDVESARALITSHLRFVIRIARGFSGYGLNLADLVQEGVIGLMKAVKNFKVDRGVRLASFAVHWIKAEMNEFVIKNWRIVKIATTKAQRQLFFNSRLLRKNDGSRLSKQEISEIAERLDVPEYEVRTMANRIGNADTSLSSYDEQSSGSGGADALLEQHTLPHVQSSAGQPEAEAESAVDARSRVALVREALSQLDDRSREVLVRRHMSEPKARLHELATELDVSTERVRQIENAAKSKLKAILGESRNLLD